MGKNLNRLFYLVNLIFTIVCFLHVTITLFNSINPPNPEIKVYERAIKDVQFPILFKICGKESKHGSMRFRNLGYVNNVEFFGGISRFSKNKTVVGWNGHTENGSTIGPLEGITLVIETTESNLTIYSKGILRNISFDWNNIINNIKVSSSLSYDFEVLNGSDLVLSPVPSFPNCKTIDIHKHFPKMIAPKQIFIKLNKIKNLGVDLYILDKHFASKRLLKSEFLAYSGPTLSHNNLKRPAKKRYTLKMTQIKDAAEDDSNGCQDYPNEKYQTFSDCDAEFVYEQMLGEGVMPFWATDNLDEVTSIR